MVARLARSLLSRLNVRTIAFLLFGRDGEGGREKKPSAGIARRGRRRRNKMLRVEGRGNRTRILEARARHVDAFVKRPPGGEKRMERPARGETAEKYNEHRRRLPREVCSREKKEKRRKGREGEAPDTLSRR